VSVEAHRIRALRVIRGSSLCPGNTIHELTLNGTKRGLKFLRDRFLSFQASVLYFVFAVATGELTIDPEGSRERHATADRDLKR
jgi:hypothetical protein